MNGRKNGRVLVSSIIIGLSTLVHIWQRRQSGLKSEGRGSGSNKFRFFQASFRKNSVFSGNLKKFNFSGKFLKNFDFFRELKIFFDFTGTNWPFQSTSMQIILFLFKSHHLRTYLLYMKNIIIFHDPSTTPHEIKPKNFYRQIIIIIIFVFQISGCQTASWFTVCALSPP